MKILLAVLAFSALVNCVFGRAVNISNTWVLPQEGFPVFYRYFRDRISWYEADAVCQFHHGNLVTVDTPSQFDAVRAYLKELDIVSNVWIGLTRASDKSLYSWAGERPLSGEGFWGEASALPGIAVCAAADPVADFRWHALSCGGPEVASFICELPVPPWAVGSNGCMLTSLPSLTVIYLPEQTALELTSDCGLDGTKRIACKGHADQQEMMRQLSCGITHDDFDEKSVSKPPGQSTTFDVSSNSISEKAGSQKAATKPWIWTSNTIDGSDYGSPTRHRRETEDTYSTSGGISLSTTDITHIKHMDTTETSSVKPFMYPTTNSNFEDSKLTSISSTVTKSTTVFPVPETTRQKPLLTTLKTDPSETSSIYTSTEETPTNDFPSINQGQLFSIIENGTLFDIIEVNDTSEGQTEKNLKEVKTTLNTNSYTKATKPSTTTTVSTAQPQIATKLPLFKHFKSPNDLVSDTDEKTFMKAMEAFPSDAGSLIKLNRTNRKELPLVDLSNATEFDNNLPTEKANPTNFKEIDRDFTITPSSDNNAKYDPHEHKIVEITITDVNRKTDATKLYVTTKKYDKHRANKKVESKKEVSVKNAENTKEEEKQDKKDNVNINIEISEIPTDNITTESNENMPIPIDSKLDELNNKTINKKDNNSEDITSILLTKNTSTFDKNTPDTMMKITPTEMDENTETDFEETETKEVDITTEEPIEPIPDVQPRPNRNRVLTRPQRRSFYPYFFSRVLG